MSGSTLSSTQNACVILFILKIIIFHAQTNQKFEI